MVALICQDLDINFPLYRGGSRSLKKFLVSKSSGGRFARDGADILTVKALSNINLELKRGDRLGVVGPNGAGKTTLLKVLAGIYAPSRGELISEGRITALLTTTMGINPDATGRENIILRGIFMDVRPKVMERYIDDVAEFSGLGDFLDLPVKTYSSGMLVRLCLAASTCFAPEIVLMDEWLSAGDAAFLVKAQKRLSSYVDNSSILVLASHSLPIIREWCNRGIYLCEGKIVFEGTVDEAIECYEADLAASVTE